MPRGVQHKAEKRGAVIASLLSGTSVSEAAKLHGLDTGTVSRWKKDISDLQLQEVADEKTEVLQELIAGYLTENLRTLRAQSIFFRSPQWLFTQNAGDAAVLHGVMADKMIRILEAAAAAEPVA